MAAECGRSRIYGGIHYECDNREGLEMGKPIGAYCSRNVCQPREGSRNSDR